MFQLIYTSMEKQEFPSADLKHLLLTSRILNRQVDVTGLLVYQAGMFLQVLEGEEEAVQTTFDPTAIIHVIFPSSNDALRHRRIDEAVARWGLPLLENVAFPKLTHPGHSTRFSMCWA
jgi:hypothetical protein